MARTPKHSGDEVRTEPTDLRPERVQLCAALAELPGWALVEGGRRLERQWPREPDPALALAVSASLESYVDAEGVQRGLRLALEAHRVSTIDLLSVARSLEEGVADLRQQGN